MTIKPFNLTRCKGNVGPRNVSLFIPNLNPLEGPPFLVRNIQGPVELETLCHMPSFVMEGIGGRLRFQGTCIPLTPVYNQVYKYRELIIMLVVVTETPF